MFEGAKPNQKRYRLKPFAEFSGCAAEIFFKGDGKAGYILIAGEFCDRHN